ncbi:MAG: hypothetical protein OXJ55_12100 [Caldilineaceae bacterium]|nr:hypothetical protein [Caldilineaceae bacterium]MDE0463558.1 hypothetical protein [Caldilineaceae bacterium]
MSKADRSNPGVMDDGAPHAGTLHQFPHYLKKTVCLTDQAINR